MCSFMIMINFFVKTVEFSFFRSVYKLRKWNVKRSYINRVL